MASILLLVLAGCASEAPDTTGLPQLRSGELQLQYTATTPDGRPLTHGTLALILLDDSTVTGEWNIQWAPGADTNYFEAGPQIGTGSLAGFRFGDSLRIVLNPGDPAGGGTNVRLFAEFNPVSMAGHWDWNTIDLVAIGGLFWTSQDKPGIPTPTVP